MGFVICDSIVVNMLVVLLVFVCDQMQDGGLSF